MTSWHYASTTEGKAPMSAFEVSAEHIDAIVTAGLELPGQYGPLAWFWPAITEDDRQEAYQRGEPWGPRAIELAQERRRVLTDATAGAVGAMLSLENRRSLDFRYDENEWEAPYEFKQLPGRPVPVIVLKALNCYEYQSCEHPEWEQSEAHAFIVALTACAISRLPGYENAPGWEVNDRRVFVTHAWLNGTPAAK